MCVCRPSPHTHTPQTEKNLQTFNQHSNTQPTLVSLNLQPSRWTRGGNPTRTAQQASTPQAVSIARTKEG
nr:MAG TPA: hypothetical protein [Caudoviricetes sp.]